MWRFDGEGATELLVLEGELLGKGFLPKVLIRLCSPTCRARGEDDVCVLPLNFCPSGLLMR